MTKTETVKIAKDLEVPFQWTWSCYSDGNKPCNECYSCRARKEAFQNLNYTDPEFSL